LIIRPFFVRQIGKSSSILALVDYQNAGGGSTGLCIAIWSRPRGCGRGMKSILVALGTRATNDLGDDFLVEKP